MDLALALLPITMIWNLQLNWYKNLGLSVLMGVLAFICAVIKTSKLVKLNARADIKFTTVSLWIWTANETNVLVLAASVPTLCPLYLILGRTDRMQAIKEIGLPDHQNANQLKVLCINSSPSSLSSRTLLLLILNTLHIILRHTSHINHPSKMIITIIPLHYHLLPSARRLYHTASRSKLLLSRLGFRGFRFFLLGVFFSALLGVD